MPLRVGVDSSVDLPQRRGWESTLLKQARQSLDSWRISSKRTARVEQSRWGQGVREGIAVVHALRLPVTPFALKVLFT